MSSSRAAVWKPADASFSAGPAPSNVVEVVDDGAEGTVLVPFERCQCDRQLEPASPGASRVEVKHAVPSADLHVMGMARHHDIDAEISRDNAQGVEVMQNVKAAPAKGRVSVSG